MCGIGGIFDFGGKAGAEALASAAAQLNRTQQHRGPDDEGVWSDNRYCVLAHRRLAIIDLSRRGRQPMVHPGGRYVISLNGEIYNYRSLRQELEHRGLVFRTGTDTEVLLAGYVEFGEAFFERLDGMFAFAIYDAQKRELLLGRDRVGEKPLYYALTPQRVAFASELRALCGLPGVATALDPYGVCQYLMLRYVPAPGTILEGLAALEPGTLLRVRADGAITFRRFFAFDREVDPLPEAVDGLPERLEDALSDAILARLTAADVPVGAYLSSGIDSSLVCAIAAKRLGRPLETFCAGFDGAEEDETALARSIAAHLQLPHITYAISRQDLTALAWSFGTLLDEPNGDRSCVPVYALSRELRKRVTVALSGDGGDELFCGYGRYLALEPTPRADPVAALEGYFDQGLPVFGSSAVRAALPEEYARWRGEFLDRYAVSLLRGGWNDAQRLSTLDFHTYLPGAVLAKVDKMSMRHALEVRSPFFAPEVMRLAAALPAELCARGTELKPILRSILTKYLEPPLINARKIGFGMPASFIRANADVFSGLLDAARETLAATAFFGARREAFIALSKAATRNVNSLWAFTALGLWVGSLDARL